MRTRFILALIAGLFASTLLAGNGYFQDRILFCLQKDHPYLQIRYEQGQPVTDLPALNQLLQKYKIIDLKRWLRSADNTDVVGDVNLSKVYRARFNGQKDRNRLEDMIRDFTSVGEIISADLESRNHILEQPQNDAYTPDDTRYGEQWFMKTIMADYAWGLWGTDTPGDPNVLIGVVDTGVDTEHPDLQGVLYLNPGEDLNGNGIVDDSERNNIDDDGNGYVDDFYGWDFGDSDNDIRPPSSGVDDALSHGTHTTGIAAAVTDNSTGVSGISFRSKVIATKNSKDADSTEAQPGIYSGYDGILYVAKLGAKFINCSWGGGYLFTYEKNILDEVSSPPYNAIVVGAAGNDEQDNDDNPQYPSDYEKCICVAATEKTDHKAWYSNWGSVVDISAPGGEGSVSSTAILSTIHWNAGGYAAWMGTSMATPVVTGSFALLKAWFPGQSRQWYWDQLLNNADPIDDLNPSYSGQLGSGRVNVYNAIARNAFPYLYITSSAYSESGGNGDGQISPGENANLVMNIKNDPLYLDADNTTITLSSTSPYLTFTDNSASLGTIAAGDSVTTADGDLIFGFTSDASLDTLPLVVTKNANPGADHPYSDSETIYVQATLNQQGFPVNPTGFGQFMTAANITGDDNLEVIGVGDNDSLYAYDATGHLLSGFPVYLEGSTTMGAAVADMDNDGRNEIVVADRADGILKIIKGDGSILLNVNPDEQVRGNIAVANMDSDPELEMVFGTMSRNLHVMNIDGTELSGFPLNVGSQIDQGVALGDYTGDGIPEMVFGLLNKELHVMKTDGTEISGFPITLSSRVNTTPLIADLKGDRYIIVTTTDKKVQKIDASGQISVLKTLDNSVKSTPALSDFNGDGTLDIAFSTGTDNKLYVINFAGDTLAPFPITMNAVVDMSPVFADLNNDQHLELVCSSDDGKIYAFQPDGSQLSPFPAFYTDKQQGSACIADLDNDGDFEVIVGDENSLNIIDLQTDKGTELKGWPTYQANNARTAYYYFDPSASALTRESVPPTKFVLYQNYPNPFGLRAASSQNPAMTTIRYDVLRAADVDITIYNVLGQRVRTLVHGTRSPGSYALKWNGRNEYGHRIGSGIYIYRYTVSMGGRRQIVLKKKMIVLQ